MWTRLINIWDRLQNSFVFLPLMIVGLAIALGVALPLLDFWSGELLPWLEMSPESAQDLLGATATAMITAASLVFSITIVTLSIATSQLGPRLMRTYMSMHSTQVALGLFVGTGIYSIMVLMTVRKKDELEVVPQLAVAAAALFTIISLVYLIYFIHKISYLIQAPNAVQAVGKDLDDAIERIYPQRFGVPAKELSDEEVQAILEAFGDNYRVVPASKEGYLESIDFEGLVELATTHDFILKLYYRPGQFVFHGSPLVKVWPFERPGVDLPSRLNKAFVYGNRPTPRQDVECSINEITELALRALSPSLNDPFTAINCIDRLAASLSRLAQREIPPPYRLDKESNLRLIARGVNFPGALDAAFHQIRQSAERQVGVQIRLLEALALIGKYTHRQEDRTALQRQADMIMTAAEKNVSEPSDLNEVRERYAAVQGAMRQAAHISQTKQEG